MASKGRGPVSIAVVCEAEADQETACDLADRVLLEDVPGVGKTTLGKGIARVFDVDFARVQFTPDLLPSDILGTQILNPREGTWRWRWAPSWPLKGSIKLAPPVPCPRSPR